MNLPFSGPVRRFFDRLDRLPPWIGPAAAACTALLVQLLFLGLLPESYRVNESADYVTFYEPVARTLAAGEPWVTPEGLPAVRYPPGYSLFLAGCFEAARILPGDESHWIGIGNLVTAVFAAAFHHLLARALIGPALAFLASLLWLTYPPFLWLGKQPNSEMPFLVFLFAGLWCVARSGNVATGSSAIAGILFAVATLIRPITLLLPLLLAPVYAFRKGRPARARLLPFLALLAVHFATLAPWEIWAHGQTGRWIPVSDGGRLSLLDGLTLAAKPDREGPPVPADVRALMETIQKERRSIRGVSDAARFLVDHASASTLAKMLWVQASRSWYATESLRFERALALLQIPYLLLATAGLFFLWRDPERRPGAVLVLCVVLNFWAMTTLVLSILRYMVPAMALLLIAAAYPLHRDRLDPDGLSLPDARRSAGRA